MEQLKTDDISDRIYVSTTANDACDTIRDYHFGIEIAEFCTAENMDHDFERWDTQAREKMNVAQSDPKRRTKKAILHAPFNELCPAAIDPLVLDIAKLRYGQAFRLAQSYGINRMVVHSGYVPFVYFKSYFVERSINFWREYLSDKPQDFTLLLENVLDDEPFTLIEIIKGLGDPRLRLCFDTGHANIVKTGMTMEEWAEAAAPYLGHLHIHNNNGAGERDLHNPLGEGSIDMAELLRIIIKKQPEATFTIESLNSRASAEWLKENGFLGN
jgi:sugar phosphate isomerase/epimerase